MESLPTVDASGSSSRSRRKPRNCQYCQRQFRRYEHLQRHIRIHTNEKPYKCSCGASFGRRDLLKRHQSIGHAPATTSTPEASPLIGFDGRSAQTQSDNSHDASRESLGEIPDLQNTSCGPDDQSRLSIGNQPQGDLLFSAQDLLVLQDLELFSQNMGLNNEWYIPSEPSITQIFAREPNVNFLPSPLPANSSLERPTESDHTLSKLPTERDTVAEFGVLTLPILTVTGQHRDGLLQALTLSRLGRRGVYLPSCHSLTRFINGFFDGFYPHLPVVHIPTFKVDDCEPEILLAMCALGAQYRHEHKKAVQLWFAAKILLRERTSARESSEISDKILVESDSGPVHLRQGANDPDSVTLRYNALMREARCAFFLIAFASWQEEDDIVQEAFNLQSFLAKCVRECKLVETHENQDEKSLDWRSWVREESDRRLKLFSFALLNLHSIAFGTPPIIWTQEIHLRLPCHCLEWIAPNQERWSMLKRSDHREQLMFQSALQQLTRSTRESQLPQEQPTPSPLANYILLHAIIQRISLMYKALPYDDVESSLVDGHKDIMRDTLHAWTTQWQRAPESSLDPRNPNGPVTFTSTALLGLAYVRLGFGFELGSYRILRCRDPEQIANRLLQLPRLAPGPHLLPAVLHATHALSIPVKLGVNFVAQSHSFVWSIQHSLCGLEFAIFLSKWSFFIADCQTRRALGEHEARLVSWIGDIVEEGRTSGDDDLWSSPSDPSNCGYLAFAVVKLWARLIRGNEQWGLLKVIGDALDMYAISCEQSLPMLS